MKKLLVIVNLFVFLFSLSACGKGDVITVSEPLMQDTTPTVYEASANETAFTPTVLPHMTSVPEEITAPEVTPINIPEKFNELTHTVKSNNGMLSATAYTTSEFSDINEVINKITIRTEAATFEITDIIGYYADMKWSYDDTKLAISYYGRQWGNFIILDIVNNKILYPETYYSDIRKYFESMDYAFDYEPNASRPDPYIYFEEWSDDSQSLKIKYTVKDIDWQTQSGSFWYDIGTGEMKDFEQYPPYQQG